MTLKEMLKAAGYTEEQITQIVKMHNDTLSGSYIPKYRFDEVNQQLADAKATVVERDGQISELKKVDPAKLEERIQQLEADNAAKDEEYAQGLAKTRKESAIRADAQNKVHDVEDFIGALDLDKIELDDSGKIKSGYNDQEKALRKGKPHWFKEEEAAKPAGFQFKGFKPQEVPEGQGGAKPVDAAVAYAKTLAQGNVQANQAAAKAAESYNIGGNM